MTPNRIPRRALESASATTTSKQTTMRVRQRRRLHEAVGSVCGASSVCNNLKMSHVETNKYASVYNNDRTLNRLCLENRLSGKNYATQSEHIIKRTYSTHCTHKSNVNTMSYMQQRDSVSLTSDTYQSRQRRPVIPLSFVQLGVVLLVAISAMVPPVSANQPPRFVLDGQSEIVIRLREGDENPTGTRITTLEGFDPDGDSLTFGVRGSQGQGLLRIEPAGSNQAHVYLKQAVDRELKDEYSVVLTLTDNKLGDGQFITQSMLILVEDVNDNQPIFKPYDAAVTVEENAPPQVLATLEATDLDEGPFGQVIYRLEEDGVGDSDKFTVATIDGKGVLRLVGSLDYERKRLYQLKVLAVDRAISGRVNTGTAAVLVKVVDVEDRPPEFIQAPSVTRIPEDIQVNSGVLQVRAVDGDRGVNNKITYSIVEGGEDLFDLDADSGFLYVKRPLDRESSLSNNGAFIIKIQAEEASAVVNPPPTATTEVTVLLEDVNDETPTFRAAHYIAEVTEGAQFNSPVNLIGDAIPEVYDHDQGNNGTFRMFLEGDNGMFDVTPPEGVNTAAFLIRVRNPSMIDYEKLKVVNFTVVARETVSDRPKSSSALVTIHIRDTNDNFPIFSEPNYEVRIPENAPAGVTVAVIRATDPDSGDLGTGGIRYTDLRGAIKDKLDLDPRTGVITLKNDNSLNREALSEHFLTVEARDDLGRGNRNTVGVRVVVTDVNDHAPEFQQPLYEARISENTANFKKPLRIEATDKDLNGTLNHEVRYAVLSGDPEGNFTLDATSGELRPVAPLDFEAMQMDGDIRYFNLTVQGFDLGEPPLQSEVSVVIYVSDENDWAPQFERLLYRKAIPEDAPGGTSVLQVHAWDQDGSSGNKKVVYRIQEGAQDKFVIHADTGEIAVAQGAILDPDRTTPRTTIYLLEVIALDGGIGTAQLQARTVVNITILDVNNKPPVFIDPGTVRVLENVDPGHFVTRVQALDPDGQPVLRYSIDAEHSEARNEEGAIVKPSEYNFASAFVIDEVEGAIRTVSELDREKVEVIRLALVCRDLESITELQTATSTLTIVIEDRNDNNPEFRKSLYRRSVAENAKPGTTIVTVVADDKDKNRTITYSLQGQPEVLSLIHLDRETGEIVVADRVDREAFSWLNFTVQATDSGVPARDNVVEVTVQVIDENDNNPVFVNPPANVTLREDAPIGTQVALVQAVDEDSGDYGRITYRLDRRSSEGKFRIDPDTGEITVAALINREESPAFNLIINAWDNYQFGFSSGESRNAFMQIGVTVADVNDEIPVFEPRSGCTMITEFHEPRDIVTIIRAFDNDDTNTPNGRIKFSIEGGNERGLFELQGIDYNTAQLFAAKPLVGQYGNYSVQIEAQDRGFPPNSVMSIVPICVTDFNDNAPIFISPSVNLTIRVPENATVGSLVIQVHAEDKDIGINGAVRYRIINDPLGNFQTFTIDPITGAILLQKPLDRERQKIYEIRVEAYDLGVPTPLSSDLDLTIYVRNVNDFEPQFLQDEQMLNFTEHKPAGAELFKIMKTVDRDDLDDDGSSVLVCYFIVGGDQYNTFNLDAFSHEIMTMVELDREIHGHYTLLIKATEDCLNPPELVSFFDPTDDTLLRLQVYVNDINDNPPKFTREIFTGGITTASDFGLEIIRLTAYDPDAGRNAHLSFYLNGRVTETLSEGLGNIRKAPFIVEQTTGIIKLNFDPQKGMKGYFDFQVYVNDTDGNSDRARVFIYLLREDQRVRFILRQSPEEVRDHVDYFRDYLGNITGAIVNVDDSRVHENRDGTVDKTKTDLYLHFVDKEDNSVLEVAQVLGMIDKNVEYLDTIFKELNVLDTQRAELIVAGIEEDNLVFLWLVGVIVFLTLLLVLTLALCLSQRARYARRLKAATATAFGTLSSHDSGVNRNSTVPNTNIHSVEGSNPIWMSGFDNEWYKDEDSLRYQHFVHASEGGDSIDDNAIETNMSPRVDRDAPYITQSSVLPRDITANGGSNGQPNNNPHNINDTYRSNLYQTFHKMGNHLVDKKLETTEL
ncbi:unnamed protein product [Meganyctiphanes norvegica]|uniref:Cadherin domain-containing protein n=1 Tax=Meganyctiphanes norvegica TaxID=48144 RepID=A0AAV2PJ09_MEGNR